MAKKPTHEELEQRIKELEKYPAKSERIEEILKEETNLSQLLLDNIPSIALLIRPETRKIVYSNKHAIKVGAVPGEKCFVSWGKSDVPCPWCLAPELWATGKTKRIEVIVSNTVWDTYWVPITEELYLHYAFDITERKKSEEKLLKQQYFLSKAQEMGKIGTWELDIKKNKLAWTDELYRIFGLPIGTELTYEAFLSCVHPDDRGYVDKEWKAAFDKKPYDIEHRLLMRDGRIKWVREKAELEFDEQGNCLRGTGFAQDITERKKAEEEIQARQQEIEEINANLEKLVQEELQKSRQKDFIMIQRSRLAAMGEMMQYIIHQWGQPLNALNILFYNLEIILDEIDIGTKEREIEETIANGLKLVKEMFSTVDDFRNFFKPHKEKIEFIVNKNIKDILSLFGDSFVYSQISVTLNETKELKVRGFPNEFSQVILNLLKNAKDAILAKKIKGKINIDILPQDDSVIIRIKDNGGGIPDDILDKVFDSYFTTKTEGDGTGIGLYMSKIIIEEHMGGKISVKNTADGAELEIALPRFP